MNIFKTNSQLRAQINRLTDMLLDRNSYIYRSIQGDAQRRAEVRHLNRALERKGKALRRLRVRLKTLQRAAIELRLAQRDYMAAKTGSDIVSAAEMARLGGRVEMMAEYLDSVLPIYLPEDKAAQASLEAKFGRPAHNPPCPLNHHPVA